MPFVSYSQNFEDVILNRVLSEVENGFYIDVGAHDPTWGSVTRAFYEKNWSGINIEPLGTFYEKLLKARKRDINLRYALGSLSSEVNFYEVDGDGLSTIVHEIAEKYKFNGHGVASKQVSMITLSEVCESWVPKGQEIHFLKIDVEGSEAEVVKGANFSDFRPWILVIEATFPNTQNSNHELWEDLVISKDYIYCYNDGLNRFYLASERKYLLPKFNFPPNYFDFFVLHESNRMSPRFKDHELVTSLKSTNDHLTQEVTSLKSTNDYLTQEVTSLKSTNDYLTQEVTSLKSTNDYLTQEVTSLKSKNDHLNLELSKFESPRLLVRHFIKQSIRILKIYVEAFFLKKSSRWPKLQNQIKLLFTFGLQNRLKHLHLRVKLKRYEKNISLDRVQVRVELPTKVGRNSNLVRIISEKVK